jgi:hypothetical protein
MTDQDKTNNPDALTGLTFDAMAKVDRKANHIPRIPGPYRFRTEGPFLESDGAEGSPERAAFVASAQQGNEEQKARRGAAYKAALRVFPVSDKITQMHKDMRAEQDAQKKADRAARAEAHRQRNAMPDHIKNGTEQERKAWIQDRIHAYHARISSKHVASAPVSRRRPWRVIADRLNQAFEMGVMGFTRLTFNQAKSVEQAESIKVDRPRAPAA